jgi:hypothetical protein
MNDNLHPENAAESDWQAIKRKQGACSCSRAAAGSAPVEQPAWHAFARQFMHLEGFDPNPRDKQHRNLYAYYCAGMWDQHIKPQSQDE